MSFRRNILNPPRGKPRQILVKNPNSKVRPSPLDVQNLGKVSLNITYDENNKMVWAGYKDMWYYKIISRESTQLTVTYGKMVRSKWIYTEITHKNKKYKAILLLKLDAQERTSVRSLAYRNIREKENIVTNEEQNTVSTQKMESMFQSYFRTTTQEEQIQTQTNMKQLDVDIDITTDEIFVNENQIENSPSTGKMDGLSLTLKKKKKGKKNKKKNKKRNTKKNTVLSNMNPDMSTSNTNLVSKTLKKSKREIDKLCAEFVELFRYQTGWKANSTTEMTFYNELRKVEKNDLKIYINLFKNHKEKLKKVDFTQVVEVEGMKKTIYDYLSSEVIKQSYLFHNKILIERFQNHRSYFEPTEYASTAFYHFCFELHCRYLLDSSQICCILDFISNKDLFIFHDILLSMFDTDKNHKNWFKDIKKSWFSLKYGELENDVVLELVNLPWTIEMYDYFINKYYKSITYDNLIIFTANTGVRSVCTFEVLKQICLSETLEDLNTRFQDLKWSMECYGLFKIFGVPQAFNRLHMLIKDSKNEEVLDAASNIITKISTSKELTQEAIQYYLVYFSQCVLFKLEGKFDIEEGMNKITPTFSEAEFLDLIKENLLSKVFKANKKGRLKARSLINDMFPKNRNNLYIEDDNRKYIILVEKAFGALLKELEGTSSEVLEDMDEQQVTKVCININEYDELCNLSGKPIMFYGSDHFLLVRIIQAMIENVTGFGIRMAQLTTILYFIYYEQPDKKGVLARMFTGEGKTKVVAMLAAFYALKGRKVDILTSSTELSIPQMEECRSFYESLGLTVDALDNPDSDEDYEAKDLDILYGTVSSYIREQLSDEDVLTREYFFDRDQDIVIVDEVDNMLFDRSASLVQISSVDTAVLMPLLYPILIGIYFHIKNSYPNYQIDEETKNKSLNEQEEAVIDYLKESFKEVSDENTPYDRVMNFTVMEDEEIGMVFPVFESPKTEKIGFFFDPDKVVYIEEVSTKVSMDTIKESIVKSLKELEVEYTIMKTYYGKYSGDNVEIWIVFEETEPADQLINLETDTFGSCNVVYEEPSFLPNSKVSLSYSHPHRLQRDYELAVKIAKQFDHENGIDDEVGIENVLERLGQPTLPDKAVQQYSAIAGGCVQVVRDVALNELDKFDSLYTDYYVCKKKLDWALGYLRSVHLYCYYSQTHYDTIGALLSDSFCPLIRSTYEDEKDMLFDLVTGDTVRASLVDDLKQFDQFIEKMLYTLEYKEKRQEVRDRRELRLRFEFKNEIDRLPLSLIRYSYFQYNLWVENCYKAIMFIPKDVGYVRDEKEGRNIKIDSVNTGVLQKNTQLTDALQQFLSMKENTILSPISLTSSFKGISYFFTEYKTIFGLTGTLGEPDTRNFLKETYDVSLVDIPSHFEERLINKPKESFYRCLEFDGLVFRTAIDWREAICESVRQQLILNRPVLVFCQSVRELHSLIEPDIKEMINTLPFNVEFLVYHATQSLEKSDYMITQRTVILATNIAGRGTDLKMSEGIRASGGLHICLTYLPPSRRVELQCVGRTARTGEMGTAQLILHDTEKRTIQQLREERDTKNRNQIEEGKQHIADLKISQKLAKDFKDLIQTYSEAIRDYRDRQECLKKVYEAWRTQALPFIETKFKKAKVHGSFSLDDFAESHKISFLDKLGKDENIDTEIRNSFLAGKNHVLEPEKKSYRHMCIALLTQKYSFWMKRYCFNNNKNRVKLTDEISDKFDTCLDYAKELLEHNNQEALDQHIFTAKEAFRLLENREKVELCLENLEELFKESGIERIYELSKQGEYQPRKDYCGFALYYYAIYKFKKYLFENRKKNFAVSLEEICDILRLSRRVIDTNIVTELEYTKGLLSPSKLVFEQLNKIARLFRNILDFITTRIEEIEENIAKKNFEASSYQIFSVESVIATRLNIFGSSKSSYALTETIAFHAKSFGFFGDFQFHFVERELDEPKPSFFQPYMKKLDMMKFDMKNLSLETAKEAAKDLYYHAITKSYNIVNINKIKQYFKRAPAAVEGVITSGNIQTVVLSMHQTNDLVCYLEDFNEIDLNSSLERLEIYLSLTGRTRSANTPVSRHVLMQMLTSDGIIEGVSESKSILDHDIFQQLDQTLNDDFIKNVQDLHQTEYNKIAVENELEQQYLKSLCKRFFSIRRLREFIPSFYLDAINGNFECEKILFDSLQEEFEEEDSVINNTLKVIFKRTDERVIEKDAVDTFVKTIENHLADDLRRAHLDANRFADAISDEIDRKANIQYKSFVLEICKPFLERVKYEIAGDFANRLSMGKLALKQTNEKVVSQLLDTAEKDIKTDGIVLNGCPLCSKKVSTFHKLQNISKAFQLIIVYFHGNINTRVFIPDTTTGTEKVVWDVYEGQWIVQSKRGTCLLDLLLDLYDVPDFDELINSVDHVETTGGKLFLEYSTPLTDELKVSWTASEHAERESFLARYADPSTQVILRERKDVLNGYHNC